MARSRRPIAANRARPGSSTAQARQRLRLSDRKLKHVAALGRGAKKPILCGPMPVHPKADEKKKRHCGEEFAEQIRVQQRFDMLRVFVIDSREFIANLLRPDRHDKKSKRRIIEAVIAFASLVFYTIVQCEKASEERAPSIGPLARYFASF